MNGSSSFSKEMAIRRRISNIYNRLEDDFATLREYNDYLEEVENIIFNLVEGVEVAATEAAVKGYEERHREQIVQNRARRAEIRAATLRGDYDPSKPSSSSQPNGNLPLDLSAAASFAPKLGANPSSGAPFGGPQPMVVQPAPVAPAAAAASSAGLQREGGSEEEIRERKRRGMRAAGWTEGIAKRRALEEAFECLWVN